MNLKLKIQTWIGNLLGYVIGALILGYLWVYERFQKMFGSIWSK